MCYETSVFNKAEEQVLSAKALKEFEGDYWSEELETRYHVLVEDGELIIQHRWLGTVELEPVAKDYFQTNQGWYVQVMRSAKNEIVGFNIHGGRTLNVFFGKEE